VSRAFHEGGYGAVVNVALLSRLIRTTVKLRPKAIGQRDEVLIRRPDDDWEVYSVKKTPPKSVTLMNVATHQTITLQGDNVHGYQSQGVLMLNCQVVTLWPRGYRLEPRPHLWAPRVRRRRKTSS
jgi:hypothetical protein